MKKVVWKFPVPSGTDAPPILLPLAAEVVHVAMEPGQDKPTAWIELDPTAPQFQRQLGFVGTGHPIPASWQHCGTAISVGGFVWHVYQGARR
jgi:hypothetical protein